MDRKRGFTLIELLVVIAIIALLMSILMPALARVRRQAQAVACKTQVRQLGMYFSMYSEDNDNYFMDPRNTAHIIEEGGSANGGNLDNIWFNGLRPYIGNRNDPLEGGILCCPTATRPYSDLNEDGSEYIRTGVRHPFAAWGVIRDDPADNGWYGKDGDFGSYGMNEFCYLYGATPDYRIGSFEGTLGSTQAEIAPWFWCGPNVRNANQIPLIGDASMWDAHPRTDGSDGADLPPATAGDLDTGTWPQGIGGASYNEMARFCTDRHDGTINMVFIDYSVRQVDLKELYILRWSRYFDRQNEYTIAGNGGDEGDCAAVWDAAAPWMSGMAEF